MARVGETVAELVVRRACEVAGATREKPLEIIGVPGDYGFSVCDAAESEPLAMWNGSSNELNSGYCADGYARLSGISVLVSTYGVGELSAINAVAGSYAERVPVLIITSSPGSTHTDAGRILHHTLAHGNDPSHYAVFQTMHEAVTGYQVKLTQENAVEELEKALSMLLTTKLPVYVNVPADTGYLPYIHPATPPTPAAPQASDPVRLAAAVAAIAARFNAAAKPLILADVGVLRAQAESELAALVEAADVPCATLVFGRNALGESHPNHVGVYGGTRSHPASAQALVESSDCLLCFGVNFTDRTTGFFSTALRPEAMGLDVKLNRTVVGDEAFEGVRSVDVIRELRTVLRKRGDAELSGWWSRRSKEDGLLPIPAFAPGEAVTSDAILATLQATLKAGDVVVVETGMMAFAADGLRLPSGVTMMSQTLWCSIGWATPAAGGAALAMRASGREGRVFLVTGDGSIQLSAQHLGCMTRDRLPVVVIVVNNKGYLLEKVLCKRKNSSYNEVPGWNYTALPAAFGAAPESYWAMKVEHSSDLTAAWERGMKEQAAGKLVLFDMVTDKLDLPTHAAFLAPAKYLDE